jgi:DNA-binding NarL/FixJ family response regulator
MFKDGGVAGWVALVANSDAGSRLAEVLGRERVDFETFEDVDALLDCSTSRNPVAAVVWVPDAVSGLLERIDSIGTHLAETAIIVSCPSIERWELRAALTAGANGVVLADDLDAALGSCLRAVCSGQLCVPRDHWRQVEPPALSAREKQILGLVVMGYMNGQIAEQLFLAESTVKSHLSSAFSKLGVRSRNEAVSLILDPDRGLGMGILSLGGEPLDASAAPAQ